MDPMLLAILSGMFGLFCVGREVALVIRTKRVRIQNLFLIMYGVTYGIVLSLLIIFEMNDIYRTSGRYLRFDYSDRGLTRAAWWFGAAVIGYIFFRFASAACGKGKNYVFTYGGRRITQLPDPFRVEKMLSHLQSTSVLCLIIGIVSFYIWTSGWGGYMTLFENAAAIRDGSYGMKNPVAFFARPALLVTTVSMISVYLINKKKNIFLNTVLFLISFTLSMMYYLANDGRMALAMYLLIVIFMWIGLFEEREKGSTKKLVGLAVCFVVFVLVILNMDKLTYQLRNDAALEIEEEPLLDSIMDELAYIYVAGQTSVKHCLENRGPLLIGHSLVRALFAWVPTSLTPKGLINVWDYNTDLISFGNAMAQYPTDMISSSLYDLGILGPILMPAFWGVVIGKLERIANTNSGALNRVIYYSVAMVLVRAVNYGMLAETVLSVFHIFVMAVVFWLISHIKWR